MYVPKYTITTEILRNIAAVEASREVIENAPLVPAWEAKFRDEALLKAAHYGTALEGNDYVAGLDGNDTITGLGGNDALNGGAGFDTAVYAGAFRQYSVSGNSTETKTISGLEGSDSLTGIERLVFLDGSLTFGSSLPAAGQWDIDQTAASVARLYWGTLGRAPEIDGFGYWVGVIKGGQVTLTQAAAGFVGSSEFQAHYGTLDNSQFVNQIYLGVLGRAAEPGGFNYWLNYLNAGGSRADMTLGFTDSPEYQAKMLGQIDHGVVDTNSIQGTAGNDVLTGETGSFKNGDIIHFFHDCHI